MGDSRDSISNTLIVAVGVSLVCSVLVSAAAVVLKPRQALNETLYRQQIVLDVAGLYEPGTDIAERFGKIDMRLVELATGEYVASPDVSNFDALEASRDDTLGKTIAPEDDIANIRRRAIYAPVYLVRDGAALEQVILPVYGSGLWSTMYGYLSLEADGKTVRGLRFYDHAETPGLGDQVEKPEWRAQWAGKQLYGADGNPRIEVVRGKVAGGPDAIHQVDGLSGATLTGQGVANLVRYWTGADGFGPYLAKLSSEEATR